MADATASAAQASPQAVPRGRFVWYDLMTTDPAAAQDFYTKLVGWTMTPFEGQPYSMWTTATGLVGGVMELPEEARAQGAPSHWVPYVAVANVDRAVEKAKGLGANVYVPPTDIPDIGRFAVLGDPQGATFSVYTTSTADWGGTDNPTPGTFSWHELMTTDYEKAFDFYQELFGWEKTAVMDMGEQGGMYQMFGRAGAPPLPSGDPNMLGGMMNIPPGMEMPPAWILYIMLDDVDEAVERVKQMGGQIIYGPMEVPGGDRVATAVDPQGATFGMHAKKKG